MPPLTRDESLARYHAIIDRQVKSMIAIGPRPVTSMTPHWVAPPPVPAELRGLSNIVADSNGYALKYAYHKINLNGVPMRTDYSRDQCCKSGPSPESPKTTLKRLRREAKRIRKEIAAVKKQAKRNAKSEAFALAAAKQLHEDSEVARQALLRVAADPTKGYASVEAARSLLQETI